MRWIGGWCGWRFSRGNGGEEARFESPNLCRTREFQEPGRSWRANLTRACLRDEPLWCRKPTRGTSWWSISLRVLEMGSVPLSVPPLHRRPVYCYLAGSDRPLSRPIREFMAAVPGPNWANRTRCIVRHRSRKKHLGAILPHAPSLRGLEDLFENDIERILRFI